jgi:hypothetical protein
MMLASCRGGPLKKESFWMPLRFLIIDINITKNIEARCMEPWVVQMPVPMAVKKGTVARVLALHH